MYGVNKYMNTKVKDYFASFTLRFENTTNKKCSSELGIFFVFICDLERARTSNHQSRNLIFYPIELRGLNFLRRQESFYDNLALTSIEIVFPSACPANSLETIPITLPISFIPSAPIWSIVITTTFSISSSVKASGRN